MLNSLAAIFSGGAGAGAGTDYESIATVTVGAGGSSTVTFSSIPSTYKHLEIRGIGRDTNQPNGSFNLRAQFNNDTGSNYDIHRLYGNGSSASADGFLNQTSSIIGNIAANGYTNIYGGTVCQILDYSNTNKNKTIRSLNGADVNGTGGYMFFVSSLWRNTSAITSITLFTDAGNLGQYSTFALYGIKG